MDESIYLGNLLEDLARLEEAQMVLTPGDAASAHLLEEIARAESLLRAWQRWSTEMGRGDFPDWCREQGLIAPAQVVRVYYGPTT